MASDARNFWLKVLAFFAAVALVFVAAFGGLSLMTSLENGWWADPGTDVMQTSYVRNAVSYKMWQVEEFYSWSGSDDASVWAPDPAGTSYRFRLTKADGTVLYDSIEGNACVLYPTMTQTLSDGSTIESAAATSLPAQDAIYWTAWLSKNLKAVYRFSPLILALSAAGLIVLTILLARTAGRREEDGRIVGTFWEKIPLDLYLVIAAIFFIGGLALLYDKRSLLYTYLPMLLILAAAVLALLTVIALMTVMTLSVRIKTGTLWSNTLVYRIIRGGGGFLGRAFLTAGRGIRTGFRAIPLVWRSLLVYGLFAISVYRFSTWYRFAQVRWLLAAAGILFLAGVYQLRILEKAGEALAEGDLNYKVDTKYLYWHFKKHGEALNSISQGMTEAVEQRLRSERLKTELITNVSHDIKTPLTSIINYVDLLKTETDPEKQQDYLAVLDRQSQRLKKLTEDLVEVSKASTGNVEIKASLHSITELLRQAVGEYSERFEAARIEPVLTVPEREVFAFIDGTLMWRVIDNLLSNACKYALDGTRFYIDLVLRDGQIVMSFKNVSRDQLNIPAEELMERFVRGDRSRTGSGSGLGLNIAKSLTELMGGTFDLSVDGDLFKAEINLPAGR